MKIIFRVFIVALLIAAGVAGYRFTSEEKISELRDTLLSSLETLLPKLGIPLENIPQFSQSGKCSFYYEKFGMGNRNISPLEFLYATPISMPKEISFTCVFPSSNMSIYGNTGKSAVFSVFRRPAKPPEIVIQNGELNLNVKNSFFELRTKGFILTVKAKNLIFNIRELNGLIMISVLESENLVIKTAMLPGENRMISPVELNSNGASPVEIDGIKLMPGQSGTLYPSGFRKLAP